jgi:hypothetical protein
MIARNILYSVAIFFSALFIAAMDFPPEGTDRSTLQCSGGVVAIGDSPRLVFKKCGEPIARDDQIGNQPYEIWVYRFPQTNYVFYFAFINNRLQRIYQVNCLEDDPFCR